MSTLTISGESGYDSGSLPEIVPQNTWQLNDTVFYTHGAHLLRFGFSVIQNRFGFFQLANPSGALGFTGTYSGAGFSDFLLGLPASSGKSCIAAGHALRALSVSTAPSFRTSGTRRRASRSVWACAMTSSPRYRSATTGSLISCSTPGTLVLAGKNGASSSILGMQKHDFSPRIGLAYRIGESTVIRAAYGLFYFNEQGIGGSTRLFINYPFAAQYTVTCSSTTPCLSTSAGIPTASSANNLPTAVYQPTANLTPNLQQWHLTVERQLSSSLVVRAAYVGSHGNHLNLNINENVAVPGPGPVAPRQPFPSFGVISSGGSRVASPTMTLSSYRLKSATARDCPFSPPIPGARVWMKARAATPRLATRASISRTRATCGQTMASPASTTASASLSASVY